MVALMGDYIYEFPKLDRRNVGYKKPNRQGVLGLYTEVRDMLKPISNKVIACLSGNHDDDWFNAENIDFVNWVCAETGMPYAGYECYVRLKIYREGTQGEMGHARNVDMVLWHGAGGGRTAGSAFNKAHNPNDSFRATNINAMGHLHRLGMLHEQYFTIDEKRKEVVAEDQYFVLTGGYQRGYAPESTYVSRKMLPPIAIGGVKLTIQPFRGIGSGDTDALDIKFEEIR
jgi:hypothetical protein